MKNQTAGETIDLTQNQFARWGIPDNIVTDCGKNYDSCSWILAIKHTISLPYHHQSKGKAESTVKIVKTLVRKSEKPKLCPYEAYFDQYNTPRHDNLYHTKIPKPSNKNWNTYEILLTPGIAEKHDCTEN